MTFEEVLASQQLTQKQIMTITKQMKKNRIYLTVEENIEERYEKLKIERNNLKNRLIEAQSVRSELEETCKNYDDLIDTLMKIKLEYGERIYNLFQKAAKSADRSQHE